MYPAPPLPDLKLFIDGQWTVGSSENLADVYNPATNQLLNRLPLASIADLDRAIAAAAAAFETWRDTAPLERTKIITAAARIVRERCDELAGLTTLEMGMRFADAKVLVMRSADILDWDANEGRRLYGRILPAQFGLVQTILREPIGPVASFAPWNGSIFTPCRKIGSALASGCTLILKAAEETPHTAVALVKIFEEVGVPPGVLNLVFGNPAEVSERLIQAPEIRLVTFTGSVPVGKHLAEVAAGYLKPSVMELGAIHPSLFATMRTFDAANKLVASKYFGAGQVCQAPSRIFVQSSVYDAFAKMLVERVKQINVGAGLEDRTKMGPLFSQKRLNAVSGLIDQAIAQGAETLVGASRLEGPGNFYAPTILQNVPVTADILHDEPFGPVMTLAKFEDLSEAIQAANSVEYGLGAFVFTRSASAAHLLSRRLQCGMVGINHFGVSTDGMPFGGVKDSGFGREGGVEGIQNYTIAKTISHLHLD